MKRIKYLVYLLLLFIPAFSTTQVRNTFEIWEGTLDWTTSTGENGQIIIDEEDPGFPVLYFPHGVYVPDLGMGLLDLRERPKDVPVILARLVFPAPDSGKTTAVHEGGPRGRDPHQLPPDPFELHADRLLVHEGGRKGRHGARHDDEEERDLRLKTHVHRERTSSSATRGDFG